MFSDKRGTNNKAIKLKLLCFFIHVYLQAICEMIKYFASCIRRAPRAKIVNHGCVAGGGHCL